MRLLFLQGSKENKYTSMFQSNIVWYYLYVTFSSYISHPCLCASCPCALQKVTAVFCNKTLQCVILVFSTPHDRFNNIKIWKTVKVRIISNMNSGVAVFCHVVMQRFGIFANLSRLWKHRYNKNMHYYNPLFSLNFTFTQLSTYGAIPSLWHMNSPSSTWIWGIIGRVPFFCSSWSSDNDSIFRCRTQYLEFQNWENFP